jgi:hypothetical protein
MSDALTREQVETAVEATWRKLEAAVQKELDSILAGEEKLTASSAQAMAKFLEISRQMADAIPAIWNPSCPVGDIPVFDDSAYEDDPAFNPRALPAPALPAPHVEPSTAVTQPKRGGRPRKHPVDTYTGNQDYSAGKPRF